MMDEEFDLAKKRIHEAYTWDIVVNRYSEVFDKLIKKETM